jgi:hypothetical protein
MQLATGFTWSRMSTHIALMRNGLTKRVLSRLLWMKYVAGELLYVVNLVVAHVAEPLAPFLIGPLLLDQSRY